MNALKVFSLILISFSFSTTAISNSKVKEGSKFPNYKLQYLSKNGKRLPASKKAALSSKALRGKVVVVDFWASWCEPCKEAMPELDKIYKKYRKKGLVVVGINVDESSDSAHKFLKDHKVKFPTIYDEGKKLVGKVGVSTMPSSYIIDQKGVVRYIHKGFHKEDVSKFKREIASLIKKK